MSIELPNARNIFIPQVPDKIDKAYLEIIKKQIESVNIKAFDNSKIIVDVINTGTSGTFKSSAGDTIRVLDGLIIALT